MPTTKGRPLSRKIRSTLSTRFLRVPREAESWSLSRGFGVVFPTCWNGQKTMLHSSVGTCPNCRKSASEAIGSLHPVKHAEKRVFGNLFVPDKGTRELLELDSIDWDTEWIRLFTRRRGPGAGQVDVEAEAVTRLSPSEPAARAEAERHVAGQVRRFFQGFIPNEDAERMILSWSAGDVLLR